MNQKGVHSFGNITWWGFSPAIDFQDTGISGLMERSNFYENHDTFNILLVGAGDLRHVLTTISRRYRHEHINLHFYIVESAMELYARHLMFLTLSLECYKRLGLQEKAEMFLELYGNILVRQQTADYIQQMSTEFIKMVTDAEYIKKKLPFLDLLKLKFKERDFLEAIFKCWRDSTPEAYDAKKCWELRVRQHLQTRYDSRLNIYDWDHSMCLTQRGGCVVNIREYKKWRDTGEAFTIREGSYCVSNRTLASTMLLMHNGDKYARRGYWGDIVVSPFVSIGIDSEERSFFKKRNGVYSKTSEMVAEYNVLSMLHELAHGERYTQTPIGLTDDVMMTPLQSQTDGQDWHQAGSVKEETNVQWRETMSSTDLDSSHSNDPQKPLDLEYESLPLDNVKVTFLTSGCMSCLHSSRQYHHLFNAVYFGNSLVHHLTPEFSEVFDDTCSVLIESALFILDLKMDLVKQFVDKVTQLASAAGCQGKKIFYITNNNTKTQQEYFEKCTRLGFSASLNNIACTAHSSAMYLQRIGFQDKIYMIGNRAMAAELDACGISYTGLGPDPITGSMDDWGKINRDAEVKCVLVGFDPDISYMKLMRAASYLRDSDCLYLATNDDVQFPLPDSWVVVPGTGAIVEAVSYSIQRRPLLIGKPQTTMFEDLSRVHGLNPSRCLMVGDRLSTDIGLARSCGLKSLLVLSGGMPESAVAELKAKCDSQNVSGVEDDSPIPNFYTTSLADFNKWI